MSLGHALVQAIVQGAGDVGPSIDKNGRSYKSLPKRTRRYRSIFGDFRIERFVYGTATNEAIQVK
jgi:hypothetical protein